MPKQRAIVRLSRSVPVEEAIELLHNELHEARLTALLILVDRFEHSTGSDERHRVVQRYLEELEQVKNWDLVDLSAPKILGSWLVEQPRRELAILRELVDSGHLWRQRVAMLATFAFIRAGQVDVALEIADLLLRHRHDLIHKAVGWMLREVGKVDLPAELQFLAPRYRQMPRTMLRYAIERFDPELRRAYHDGVA